MRAAAKRRKGIFAFARKSFSLYIFSFFSSVTLGNLSKPIMPRVKSWAGGGACPQGYPVPAFRFSNELDPPLSHLFILFLSFIFKQLLLFISSLTRVEFHRRECEIVRFSHFTFISRLYFRN